MGIVRLVQTMRLIIISDRPLIIQSLTKQQNKIEFLRPAINCSMASIDIISLARSLISLTEDWLHNIITRQPNKMMMTHNKELI